MKRINTSGIVFHLAIPTHDLDAAEGFYTEVIGAERARRYHDRVTFNFYGHQIVCHLDPDGCDQEVKMYPRHFGITFTTAEPFDALYRNLSAQKEWLFKDLFTRFADLPERHRTFFVKDSSNNLLEFKCYDDPQFVY